jgi:hypothetical protein
VACDIDSMLVGRDSFLAIKRHLAAAERKRPAPAM